MSDLKPCPFCGADAKVTNHGSFKIAECSNLSMLCPNPTMTVYNDDFKYWNTRIDPKELTTLRQQNAELVEALINQIDCPDAFCSSENKTVTQQSIELLQKIKEQK